VPESLNYRRAQQRVAVGFRAVPATALLSLLLLTVAAGLLSGTGSEESGGKTDLTLFAASSLTDLMEDVAHAFERRHPSIRVVRNYAASSRLALQIRHGIDADVFASAGRGPMKRLEEAGAVGPGAATIFAENRLVLIVPADNPSAVQRFTDVGRRQMKLAVAAPGVPARSYADEIVQSVAETRADRSGFLRRYRNNIVSEETNVRQVAARVALGEADAGIVYATDVTPDIADRVEIHAPPPGSAVRAQYPVAVLGNAEHPAIAARFVGFLRSEEGARYLRRHGFVPMGEGQP